MDNQPSGSSIHWHLVPTVFIRIFDPSHCCRHTKNCTIAFTTFYNFIYIKHIFVLCLKIEQKGMTFDNDFCYSFFFSCSPFFLVGKRKGEENNQSNGQKSCLSARSCLKKILKKFI